MPIAFLCLLGKNTFGRRSLQGTDWVKFILNPIV